MEIDAKKIGYLRRTPAFGCSPEPATGAAKALLRKFQPAGLVISFGSGAQVGFTRSQLGDAEVHRYDRNLPSSAVDILRAVVAERPSREFDYARGLHGLIDCGLIIINSEMKYVAHEDARQKLRAPPAEHVDLTPLSAKELATDIFRFLNAHAGILPDYDDEFDAPDERFTSPDAAMLFTAATRLSEGLQHDAVLSSWGSGGYRSLTDLTAKNWHDRLVKLVNQSSLGQVQAAVRKI